MQTVYNTQSKGAEIVIICRSEKTRNGFRHIAEIQTRTSKKGYFYTLNTAKINYLNRTWERYNFESVIHKALENCLFCNDKAENAKRIKAIKTRMTTKPSRLGLGKGGAK